MGIIIDVHSHILPSLDDGAADMKESIEMIRSSCGQGIRHVIATPHYSGQFRKTSPDKIRRMCREVQKTVNKEHGIGIKIYPGQEIMYTGNTVNLLRDRKVLTMADSSYVLVEFLSSADYTDLYRAARELKMHGYRPIIAHAERYGCLRKKGRVEELRKNGAYIQLNYSTVGGRWHKAPVRWSRRMLRKRNVDFLGTDMHNMRSRKPTTESAVRWMKSHLSGHYAWKIMYGNAEKMIANEKV